MKLYGLSTRIVRVLETEEHEEQFGLPDLYDTDLELDADTNTEIATELKMNWNAYTLSTGVLYRDGQPVIINQPGQRFLDRATVKEFWDDLGNGIDWLENAYVGWDALTNTGKQAWLANNFGTVLYINYRVLRFLRWFIKAILKPIWA